ncbi:MAG: response regulator [Chloroflexota bacterium]
MKNVLIVEDDRDTVRLLSILLSIDGYEVHQASTADDALRLAREGVADRFIIDAHLSDSSGLKLVKQLRSEELLNCHAIVVISGLDMSHKAISAGADAFLLKPFQADDLFAALEHNTNI